MYIAAKKSLKINFQTFLSSISTLHTNHLKDINIKNNIMKKILFMTVILTSVVMASCNVTRTVTTQSQYYQKGDTSVVIQTKTIESYDGSKN